MNNDMSECALHMQDAARLLKNVNEMLGEHSQAHATYDEALSALTPEEREAFADVHEALDALRAVAKKFSSCNWYRRQTSPGAGDTI